MLRHPVEPKRELRERRLEADLVVVGGGMAGICAAITAARAGAAVVLLQDRPVLGGNASSEVRLWVLGATSHMGNNNRWAREGGVIDEIMVENTYRNPEGNAVILDTILLEKTVEEPNLTLLLNTSVFDLEKSSDGARIDAVRAFCSQSSTTYRVAAPMYADASGDGVVAFMAGAPFRYGSESRREYGEMLAPKEDHKDLLGHSIFFYTRDVGKPVSFVPPSFALSDITKVPRYKRINTKEFGCQLWWIEYGGSLDTVHETERIKWELWKVIYGVWDYVKNSGKFPDAETLTLDWVGMIPGKRESRRFEGDYMMIQQDIVQQREHYDAVSFGGWAIDQHPVDNVYSDESPCTQWHSKGVYQIPFRSMYSRSVDNLLLAGRAISASHIAFCSTRVMATCGHNGQAIGMAGAICARHRILPRELAEPERIGQLQTELLRAGQFIPGVRLADPDDLAANATVTASSRYRLGELSVGKKALRLTEARGMLLPLRAGKAPRVTFHVEAEGDTTLDVELRTSSRLGNFTPDVTLERVAVPLWAASDNHEAMEGEQHAPNGAMGDSGGVATKTAPTKHATTRERSVTVEFSTRVTETQYAFVCLMPNPSVSVATSEARVSGVLSVVRKQNAAVAVSSVQSPPKGSGVDSFEFWIPERRPRGQNLAITVEPTIDAFSAGNVVNGHTRPTTGPNAWVASADDQRPTLRLEWDAIQKISRIELAFDTDFDHPMESVLMQHPERVTPFCVQSYRLLGFKNQLLHECDDNHQTRNTIRFDEPVLTDVLSLELTAPSANVPASLFEIRCYGPDAG